MELRFQGVRQHCEDAVQGGVVPGLVLLVGAAGKTVFHEAFGFRQLHPARLRALPDTVYDLASLTKAVVTSVVTMQLVERGTLGLEDRIGDRLAEFRGAGKDIVTVRHLLAHASGLPAHRPFWKAARDAPSERWAISLLAAHEPLAYQPGSRSLYSDLGFIVLGWVLERAAGLRLDVQADRGIVAPLGLASTTFVNLADSEARARLLANRTVAATQLCPERKRVILGEVDDLNAYAMGGIAAHAGLFSTAIDLGAIAAALCAAWKGAAGTNLVSRDVIRQFWNPAGFPESTWRLGWDGPSREGSQAGQRLSRDAVGHLAFTGCSLWIDPQRELWIVLLSNRVHPQIPDDDRFRQFRPALHDAVVDAIGSA
ncbi:MAG TPA: serine hydrolase domain-containing protein [Polyangia bacterium]|jgi:CubicO group peptidase (beta-lactamase class C family)|nr:serine hydrolase domain-containing protein [Polyangia bacterium]